jgi:hypothetical protein
MKETGLGNIKHNTIFREQEEISDRRQTTTIWNIFFSYYYNNIF